MRKSHDTAPRALPDLQIECLRETWADLDGVRALRSAVCMGLMPGVGPTAKRLKILLGDEVAVTETGMSPAEWSAPPGSGADLIVLEDLMFLREEEVTIFLTRLRDTFSHRRSILIVPFAFTGCSWSGFRLDGSGVWTLAGLPPTARPIRASKARWLRWFHEAGWMPVFDPGTDCIWFTPSKYMVAPDPWLGRSTRWTALGANETLGLLSSERSGTLRAMNDLGDNVRVGTAYRASWLYAKDLDNTFFEVYPSADSRPWLVQCQHIEEVAPSVRSADYESQRYSIESVLLSAPQLGSFAGIRFRDQSRPIWAYGAVTLRRRRNVYHVVNDFSIYGG